MADSPTTVQPLGVPRLVPTSSLKPSRTNPRRISDKAVEMVARSLREFGWQQAIIADADGVILAGHTRLRAAKMLGLTQVPCITADGLTPAQARAYRVADNRTSDYTTWDFPELARELEAIGPDFAEVLGVADWADIMGEFDSVSGGTLSDEENAVTDEAFHYTIVTFGDEATAAAAAAEFFEVDGVIDVRNKR